MAFYTLHLQLDEDDEDIFFFLSLLNWVNHACACMGCVNVMDKFVLKGI